MTSTPKILSQKQNPRWQTIVIERVKCVKEKQTVGPFVLNVARVFIQVCAGRAKFCCDFLLEEKNDGIECCEVNKDNVMLFKSLILELRKNNRLLEDKVAYLEDQLTVKDEEICQFKKTSYNPARTVLSNNTQKHENYPLSIPQITSLSVGISDNQQYTSFSDK